MPLSPSAVDGVPPPSPTYPNGGAGDFYYSLWMGALHPEEPKPQILTVILLGGNIMPNYIQQLQTDNANLKKQLTDAQDAITTFLAYLGSEKFTGQSSDGTRKDWISTGDVVRWGMDLRSQLHPGA